MATALSCFAAIIFLMDASQSVNLDNYRLQREGTAAAIESEQVIESIARNGPVAMRGIEFASSTESITQWRIIRNGDDARNFAREFREYPILSINLPGSRNSLGLFTHTTSALVEARSEIERAPCETDNKIIDISTDGPSNDYMPVQPERDRAHEEGIRINGIGIGVFYIEGRPLPAAEWIQNNLTTPGGFTIQVDNWSSFTQSIRRKLVRELG